MGTPVSNESFIKSILGRIRGRKPVEEPKPLNTPVEMLERLHGGEQPDYCLYIRPGAGGVAPKTGPLSVDLEELLVKALEPLPMLTLDEIGTGPGSIAPLPDEAFLTLANRARILILAPMPEHRFILRLRLIKALGPIGRCIFVMPEQGTLGNADWPNLWSSAADATAKIGIELSTYTAGGWLFRVDREGKAVTFRPIVNPNPQKIAKAIEGICGEME